MRVFTVSEFQLKGFVSDFTVLPPEPNCMKCSSFLEFCVVLLPCCYSSRNIIGSFGSRCTAIRP